MTDLTLQDMEGPAWEMAERDATLFGSGFVLKTPRGDIRIPPDKISFENPRRNSRRIRTDPIDLIVPGDRLYWLHRWGREVRICYCGPTGHFPNDAASHPGS
jgi:hypothetical protein